MDVILSGRFLSAEEALDAGLVARRRREGGVARGGEARRARHRREGPVATRLAKEAVDRAYEAAYARARVRAAAARSRLRVRRFKGGPDGVPGEAPAGFQREVAMPNVEEILEGARDAMTVGRVYGDPIEHRGRDGHTRRGRRWRRRRWRRRHDNGGAGFGLQARPVGAYVIRGQDVTWVPGRRRHRSRSTASSPCCSVASCCAADSASDVELYRHEVGSRSARSGGR